MNKPMRWLIAGVLLGIVIVAPIADHDAHHSSDLLRGRVKAAKAFMAEYKASRYAKYRATQRFVRVRDGKPAIGFDVEIDQDPPRSVSVSSDNQNFIFPGYYIGCTNTEAGLQCAKSPAPSWDDSVKTEMAALQNYLFSNGTIYVVTREKNNCYRLDNVFPSYQSPPYGDKARFCFDSRTHVPISKDIYRGRFVDKNEYVNVGAPRDSDFKLPDEAKDL